MDKKTLCFATMCKNNEHNILKLLNNIYKYIDYWVINDTGSTDNTIDVINNFFKDKNIPGELHKDNWVSTGYNKTLLFDKCYKKTDFIIYLDCDDILEGYIPTNKLHLDNIGYNFLVKTCSIFNKEIIIFNNNYKWKASDLIYDKITCINNYEQKQVGFLTDNIIVTRNKDCNCNCLNEEHYNKALLLQEQFFNTLMLENDDMNTRIVFYTAQSYYNSENYNESLKWYKLYTKIKNIQDEELYESYNKIVSCMIYLTYKLESIIFYASKSIYLFKDRAEIYYILCNYFIEFEQYDLAFFNIIKASECNLKKVKQKYSSFIDENSYYDKIKYLISFLAYKTENYEYGLNIFKEITIDCDEKRELEKLYNSITPF